MTLTRGQSNKSRVNPVRGSSENWQCSLGARRVDVLRVQRSEFDKGCQNIHTIVMGGRVGDPFIDLYSIDLYSIFIAVTANRDV